MFVCNASLWTLWSCVVLCGSLRSFAVFSHTGGDLPRAVSGELIAILIVVFKTHLSKTGLELHHWFYGCACTNIE